jgi:hypothetical protein
VSSSSRRALPAECITQKLPRAEEEKIVSSPQRLWRNPQSVTELFTSREDTSVDRFLISRNSLIMMVKRDNNI